MWKVQLFIGIVLILAGACLYIYGMQQTTDIKEDNTPLPTVLITPSPTVMFTITPSATIFDPLSTEGVKMTVESFYEGYIDRIKSPSIEMVGSVIDYCIQMRKESSIQLSKNIASKRIGRVEFDPVVCQSQIPESIRINRSMPIDRDQTTVYMMSTLGGVEREFSVGMVIEGGVWKTNDVICSRF